MMGGKGGLNIKDYPFAFSVAALLFPEILQTTDNPLAPILTITIVGGMLGSMLTIINPFGLAIREIYWRTKQSRVYTRLNFENNWVRQILKKNFRAALSSPPISFEMDKMVGMIYFLIVLGFAIFRTTQPDFITSLNLTENTLWGIRIGAGIGFVSVFVVLHYHVRGFVFRSSKKAISHLDRIRTVTISNLAVDFSNLSNEGNRWNRYTTNHSELRLAICDELVRIHNHIPVRLLRDHFTEDLDLVKMKNHYSRLGHRWNDNTTPNLLFFAFRSVWEITNRYETTFPETTLWFRTLAFLNPTEFDEPIGQLQDSIESRDWYNATLKTYRITDRLEDFLEQKNMPKRTIF